jgi:hypothetical protein
MVGDCSEVLKEVERREKRIGAETAGNVAFNLSYPAPLVRLFPQSRLKI